MKRIYLSSALLAFVLFGAFASCNKESTVERNNAAQYLIDSFSIELEDVQDQLITLSFLDKDTMFMFNRSRGEFFWLTQDLNNCYRVRRRAYKEFDNFAVVKVIVDSTIHFFNFESKTINTYKNGVYGSYSNSLVSPILGEDYRIQAELRLDPYQYKDKVVLYFGHNSLASFAKYLKAPCFAVYEVVYDTLSFKRFLLEKPTNLGQYAINTLVNSAGYKNHIYSVFPNVDTLYKTNLDNYSTEKFVISNPDFTPAKPYNYDSSLQENNGGYEIQYALSTFSYNRILVNPKTEHLCLFYTEPLTQKENGNLPTPFELETKCLVLDKTGKILRIVHFGNGEHFKGAFSCFIFPTGGIAVRLNDSATNDNHASYAIYNL